MHYFRNFETVIDDVHRLFDALENEFTSSGILPIDLLHTAKMAVHEWIANVVQHSKFNGKAPEIGICLAPRGERLYCLIEDNSIGFDLQGYLDSHEGITTVLPDRGMGLLLLKACSEELCYRPLPNGKNQLEFYITDQEDSFIEIPFHE